MKVRVEQTELHNALGWLQPIIPSRPYLPSLAGVKIEAADGHLILQGTDLERAGRIAIPAAVDEPGAAVLPLVTTPGIIAKLPAGTVTIATEDTTVTVTGGTVHAYIPTLHLEDFPQLPTVDDGVTFTMTADLARSIAQRVAPAVGGPDQKPYIQGVNLIVADGTLTAGATDKYRYQRLDVDCDADGDGQIQVPADTFGQAARMGDELQVTIGEDRIQFGAGSTMLTAVKMAGDPPSPDQFFEVHGDAPVVFDRGQLAESLHRCMVIASAKNNVPARITFDEGTAELAVEQGGTGRIVDTIPADGDAEPVNVSPERLLAAVKAHEGEKVRLWPDGYKPILVEDPDGSTFQAIVMPMRVSN